MARLFVRIALAIACTGVVGAAEATDCVRSEIVLRSSRVAGQVFDRDGVPIPGALVSVSSPGRGVEIETDAHGYFEAPDVAPGRGSVQVEVWGFEYFRIPAQIDEGLPFHQLAVRLGIGMSCDTRACAVLLPSATFLHKAPPCLDAPFDHGWTSTRKRLDRAAAKCAAGNEGACWRLARTAEKDEAEHIREYAAKVLTSEPLLAELARRAPDVRVRRAATANLRDQAVIAAMAERDPDDSVRAAAVTRLTDPALLAHYATRDTNDYVRAVALRNPALTDQNLLADIARRDPEAGVRVVAALKLVDRALAQRVFVEVAHAEGPRPGYWVHIAIGHLTDQVLLTKFATSDPDQHVRRNAVERLDDPGLLARIAATDPSVIVRVTATGRLTDRDRLSHMARRDPNWWVRQAARETLKKLRRAR